MRNVMLISVTIFMLAGSAFAQETIAIQQVEGTAQAVDPSLRREGLAAVQRAVAWLLDHQDPAGYWSNEYFPALTALPLWAITWSDVPAEEATQKAIAFILDAAHDTGAIYREPPMERKGGGLSTYNTALCMIALHEQKDSDLNSVILKARAFVAASQHLGGDIYRGGMGYDASTGRAYADLSNSYIAYEAMRVTEDVEDYRPEGEESPDLNWQAAQEFLARTQNLPSTNDAGWVSDDPDAEGGFVYRPDLSQAGIETNAAGEVSFRTYGSMTYAGLLSLIYADVDRDDERVRSAYEWAGRHWTLEENPGMGQEGLYYFYNVLPKALAAYGRNEISTDSGKTINWRNELIRKLVSLQRIDPETGHGFWVNDNGRWWEADPILVTSYAVLALETALNR